MVISEDPLLVHVYVNIVYGWEIHQHMPGVEACRALLLWLGRRKALLAMHTLLLVVSPVLPQGFRPPETLYGIPNLLLHNR